MFFDDVKQTHERLLKQAATASLEQDDEEDQQRGVEQIQLQAVDHGEIAINIPRENATEDVEVEAWNVFSSFSPETQAALRTQSLDEINKVLATMPVDEAEALVGLLGSSGIMSVAEQIIDTTKAKQFLQSSND